MGNEEKDLSELKDPNKSKDNELKSYQLSHEFHTKKGGASGITSSSISLSPSITNSNVGSDVRFYEAYNSSFGLILPKSGTNQFNPESQIVNVQIFDKITGRLVGESTFDTANFITKPLNKDDKK